MFNEVLSLYDAGGLLSDKKKIKFKLDMKMNI